jgi:hypothetical protein|tara:strand:- start:5210 stop:5854 length:645 start_codon:yes stop_codon:yes gene_type:complete
MRYHEIAPALDEVDRTGEIDFSNSDSFEEVIKKVRNNQDNRLGFGKYREGWHHPFDKRLVIKYAHPRDNNTLEDCALRNFWEFLVWNAAKDKGGEELDLLMPCHEIHPDGHWLTQRKGTRVPNDKEIPVKGKAAWIGDRKKENFAMLDGDYKDIDYGSKKALEHFNLPEDHNTCKKLVMQILKKTSAPINDPNYGKSQKHNDPLNPDAIKVDET